MNTIPLHFRILIGLFLGICWAVAGSFLGWSEFTINWLDPFGQIFINLFKLIAVPLVLFSIIKGVSGLSDVRRLGRLGIRTLGFYLVTTVFAVSIGLLVVNMVKPGARIDDTQRKYNRAQYEQWVKQNVGIEIIDGQKLSGADQKGDMDNTMLKEKFKKASEQKESGPLQFLIDMVPSNIFLSLNDNSLMLQVIFFGIFFGISLLLIDQSVAQPVIQVVSSLTEVFLKMVDLIMQAAPFFVFALLAGTISKLAGDNPKGVLEIFISLGWYSVTVLIGLGILLFLVYPNVMTIVTKKISYKGFFKAMGPAQALAFSTSSSAATLPVTMKCVKENLGVPDQISGFVLPIGATLNMDGTSLHQAVAVVFLAQFHMVDLTVAQQLVIVFTATLASIGSAAVPSAGLVMLIIVLESVGLNPAWIAIIFPVDRILDMCRTTVNVSGDALASGVIAHSEGQLDYKAEG